MSEIYSHLSSRARLLTVAAGICLLIVSSFQTARAQEEMIGKADRDRGHQMLRTIRKDLDQHYFDPAFRGVDIETRFKTAHEMIDRATSIGQILGIIAQAVLSLNDSHTFYMPPQQSVHVNYGWDVRMIGDKCYITLVKAGSDAEAQGVKVGDRVHAIDGIAPTKETLWKLLYLYTSLRYQNWVRLALQSPDGKLRELDVKTKVYENKEEKHLIGSTTVPDPEYVKERKLEIKERRNRTKELGEDSFVWKMPRFVMPQEEVDDIMKKVRKRKSLILDLRGNPGGRVVVLLRMVDNFFEGEVKVADRKGRKEMKPQRAKGRGEKAFKGKVVVLVDSESASAAELFARVMQIEKRGTVIGDRTAGAVMESLRYFHDFNIGGKIFNSRKIFYGMSITDADLIMTDGRSLEDVGVQPDEVILPTGADLAAKRDPVMARAAELVGVKLTPQEAAIIFAGDEKD